MRVLRTGKEKRRTIVRTDCTQCGSWLEFTPTDVRPGARGPFVLCAQCCHPLTLSELLEDPQ